MSKDNGRKVDPDRGAKSEERLHIDPVHLFTYKLCTPGRAVVSVSSDPLFGVGPI